LRSFSEVLSAPHGFQALFFDILLHQPRSRSATLLVLAGSAPFTSDIYPSLPCVKGVRVRELLAAPPLYVHFCSHVGHGAFDEAGVVLQLVRGIPLLVLVIIIRVFIIIRVRIILIIV